MIIEFIGLPGSGKTTLSKMLVARLEDAGVEVVTPSQLSLRWQLDPNARGSERSGLIRRAQITQFRFQVFHENLALLLLAAWRLLKSKRTIHDKWFAFRLMFVALERRHFALRTENQYSSPKRVVVFDEGVYQRAFLLFVDSLKVDYRKTIVRFSRLALYPSLLLFVDTEPQLALQRLPNRSRKLPERLDGLNYEIQMERMAAASEMLCNLVNELNASDRIKSIKVDGNCSVDMVDEQIWIEISDLLDA